MGIRASGAALLLLLAAVPAGAQDAAMSGEIAPGLTAKIVSLKRLPGQKLVQLDYTLENGGAEPADLDALVSLGGIKNIGLLDFAGERVYEVGTADGCLCSQAPEGNRLGAGATFSGWAWFMPPDAASKTVAVRFGTARPIMDVPMQ